MKRNPELIMRQVDDKYVLSPVGDMAKSFSGMITMNSTGKFLWDCLEREQTMVSLAQALTENYDVDMETATQSLPAFLNPLKEIQAVVD